MERKNMNENQDPFSDPSVNLWSTYLSMSEKDNRAMAQNWKGDMDAILIFAGLFSASLTAFIVESYKTLNPSSPNDASVLILAMSQQLRLLNTSGPQFTDSLSSAQQSSFSPAASAIVCNYLWFLSLSFSLICALSATLVEQWTRRYLQATMSRPAPQDRARMGAFLYQGIKVYRMATIVEVIPMLLHISLFLFFAGLVAFLAPLNSGLEYLIATILSAGCILYVIVSILPVLDLSCPFWTPLSTNFWALFRKIKPIRRKDPNGNPIPVPYNMSDARELDAIQISPARDERDLQAICCTISSQREDHEFEPFVENISNVVSSFDYSAKWLIKVLLDHPDPTVRLGTRIPRLLATCTAGILDKTAAQRRAVTCIRSIWSLAMLDFPRFLPPSQATWRSGLKFKEDTFNLLYDAQKSLPNISGHVVSTSVAIARSMLDMYVDRIVVLEDNLLNILAAETTTLHQLNQDRALSAKNSEIIGHISVTQARIQALQTTLSKMTAFTTTAPYATLEYIAVQYQRIIELAMSGNMHTENIQDTLRSIQMFQEILTSAGFYLALEYIGKILESDDLPHEAFQTLRRAFLRINFHPVSQAIRPDGKLYLSAPRTVTFTKEAQERLVHHLEEAVEFTSPDSMRLPRHMVDIIINMTKALSDPTLLLKAKYILQDFARLSSNEAAARALDVLKQKMPEKSGNHHPADIFTSHIYSHAKPDQPPRKKTLRANASLGS